ncbi:MAG TPA: alpha/beta fold hydrolase [Usitatibacter sp.]|nr:alpha/beta fold hydrolase [Usitatibacter sp.]
MKRESMYVGEGASAFFACYHSEEAAPPGDRVAVVCGPIGYEYTRAHRTLRHLADSLARAGIPALRFDYHGIGDSAGSDIDPDRLGTWKENIRTAIEQARALSGCDSVCLVGVRLGATLAAIVAHEMGVDELVLWNPVIKGRPYVRELQAIAMSAERGGTAEGALESAGSIVSDQTLAALRETSLLDVPLQARRILVAGRDDQAPDMSLNEYLTASGVVNEYTRLPGWDAMMAEHMLTVVPEAALEKIVEWITREPAVPRASRPASPAPARTAVSFPVETQVGNAIVEESLCAFGKDSHLLGVLSRSTRDTERPAIVIFNAGAVHRVGPNRMSVTLARHFAAMGLACLRFDLEGIGDSVLRGSGRENHPYPETALADARAAFDFLRRRHGYTRFIAMGLCSGAHTTFHAGLQLADDVICELILINPITFYWTEGMDLDSARHFEDAIQYRKAMRNPDRWLKLLRGGVDFRHLALTVTALVATKVKSHRDALRERLMPLKASPLSRDLRRLHAMNRAISLFLAEDDPGREILLAGARLTATRALKSGALRLEIIPGADHTFSQLAPRMDLVKRLIAHLRPYASS